MLNLMMLKFYIEAWLGAFIFLAAAPLSNLLFPGYSEQCISDAWWIFGVMRSAAILLFSKAIAHHIPNKAHKFFWDLWIAIVYADLVDRALFERSDWHPADFLLVGIFLALGCFKHQKLIRQWIRL